MRYLYLTSWQAYAEPDGTTSYSAPYRDLRLGTLDFRSEADLTQANFLGPGLFVYAEEHPDLDLFIANAIDERLNNKQVADIEDYLSLPRGSITERIVVNILWQLFTDLADPTGKTRWRPISPTDKQDLNLHLGGFSRIKTERFKWNVHPHTAQLRAMYRDAYERFYDKTQSGKLSELKLRAWLGGLENKFRVPANEFISPARPPVEPIDPSTLLTDDFAGDLSAWGTSDGTWAASTNDRLECTANGGNGRASILYGTAQSSADHYVQGDMYGPTDGGTTGKTVACCPRMQDTNNCLYGGVKDNFTPALVLGHIASDSLNEAASQGSFGWTGGWTAQCEADGTDVRLLVDSGSGLTEEIAPQTITNFQTELEVGYWTDRAWEIADNFESDDLGAAAQSISPSPVTVPVSIQAPSIAATGAASISPSPVTVPVAIQAPSVAGSGAATITVTPVAVTVAIQGPSIANATNIDTSPVSSTVAIQAPSVAGSGAATITVTPVAVTVAIQGPSIAGSGAATITVSPVSVTTNAVAPSIANASNIDTSPVTVPVSIQAPSVAGSGATSISPSPVAVTAAIASPSIAGSGASTITVSPLSVSVSIVAPTLQNAAGPTGEFPLIAIVTNNQGNQAVITNNEGNQAVITDG